MSSFQHMHWVNKQPYKAHIQKHRIQGSERGNDLFTVTWLTSVALGSPPRSVRGQMCQQCVDSQNVCGGHGVEMVVE